MFSYYNNLRKKVAVEDDEKALISQKSMIIAMIICDCDYDDYDYIRIVFKLAIMIIMIMIITRGLTFPKRYDYCYYDYYDNDDDDYDDDRDVLGH